MLFLTSIFLGFGLDFGGSWASKMEPSWLLRPQKFTATAPFYLLKLNVFKKWRLGGLRARFWRPRGSILEGPGSIFKGFWTFEPMPEGLSGWRTLRHRLVLHHWAVRGREVVEILPSHRTSASNACASVSWQRWARCSRSGWPAVSPPGGLQSAAHRRCAGRAESKPHRLQPKLQILPQMAKLLMASSSS